MSSRNLSCERDDVHDEEEELSLLRDNNSKGERPSRRGVVGKCCFIMWKLRFVIISFFFLFSLFILLIASFRMSNVEEIIMHPNLFPDYVTHFGHSMDAIGQDSTLFDSLKAAHPITYSKQDKKRLDFVNNPDHLVWGGEGVELQKKSCVLSNESYLLMVLNTPSAITANMESFVKMSTETNHFIVSHTFDFLPHHPSSVKETSAKEKTMTSYFSKFAHKTASVASFPYLNFEQFQLTAPVYIGTIRDPITRLQSQYDASHDGHDNTHSSSKMFQDCVRTFIRNNISAEHLVFGTDMKQLDSTPLRYDVKRKILKIAEKHNCFSTEFMNVQVQAYCGLDCQQLEEGTAEGTLQMAIEHMNSRFRVVVVTEQLPASVRLLERVIPDFFSGLSSKAAPLLQMSHFPVSDPQTPSPISSPSPFPTPAPTAAPLLPRHCPTYPKFCSCEGTLYYGKAFVNGRLYESGGGGPICTLEELKALPHLSKDVSSTGGAKCSHTALGMDPLVGYTKQCICDPNKPSPPPSKRNLRMSTGQWAAEKNRTASATAAAAVRKISGSEWKLSSHVTDYLRAVLRYEYRLYAAAKQHLAGNLAQCGIQK